MNNLLSLPIRIIIALMLILFVNANFSHADTKRTKVLDFEDDLIEGMNKKPLDSLQQISNRMKNKKSYLYRKRKGFSVENQNSLIEARYRR